MGNRRTGDFPMAGRRILAGRLLDAVAEGGAGRPPVETRGEAARRCFGRGTQAQAVEVGEPKRPRAQSLAVAGSGRAGFGDVAERVGARVAIGVGVRRRATPHRIKNDDERASHSRYEAITPEASASTRKAAANRALVYSVFGSRKMSTAGPDSTILPCRMTMISAARARTTLRSWLMNR